MRSLVLLGALFVAPRSVSAGPLELEVWTRTPANYGGEDQIPRTREQRIAIDRLPAHEAALRDAQYDATNFYRYVSIEDVIRSYAPPPDVDTALLHFSNGMIVPLPFRDPAAMHRLRPIVVLAMKIDGTWSTSLPSISKGDEYYYDVRPIRFDGNKLAVAELWHPALRSNTAQTFSPWRYTDTLTGIEFASDAAFLAQLTSDPAAHAGAKIYGEVCRFCHGARHVGAQFGWDFLVPLPIAEYRKNDTRLYYHLHWRPSDAPVRGLMMPALSFLTERDAADLMVWLRALAASPLRPYAPAPR